MEGTTAGLEARVAELEHDSRRVVFALLDLVDVVQTIVRDLTAFSGNTPASSDVVALREAS